MSCAVADPLVGNRLLGSLGIESIQPSVMELETNPTTKMVEVDSPDWKTTMTTLQVNLQESNDSIKSEEMEHFEMNQEKSIEQVSHKFNSIHDDDDLIETVLKESELEFCNIQEDILDDDPEYVNLVLINLKKAEMALNFCASKLTTMQRTDVQRQEAKKKNLSQIKTDVTGTSDSADSIPAGLDGTTGDGFSSPIDSNSISPSSSISQTEVSEEEKYQQTIKTKITSPILKKLDSHVSHKRPTQIELKSHSKPPPPNTNNYHGNQFSLLHEVNGLSQRSLINVRGSMDPNSTMCSSQYSLRGDTSAHTNFIGSPPISPNMHSSISTVSGGIMNPKSSSYHIPLGYTNPSSSVSHYPSLNPHSPPIHQKISEHAISNYRTLASQGYAEAQYNLAYCYENGINLPQSWLEAFNLYKLAASQGHPKSQHTLGTWYDQGHHVIRNEYEAVKYYRLAAQNGYAPAQCNLAFCYYKGLGVEQNIKETVRLYKLAADKGYAAAQYNLGIMYDRGHIEKNLHRAVAWYERAAEQRYPPALFALGRCYESGQGVNERDERKAVDLYKRAATTGLPDAQYRLSLLL